MGRIRYGIKNTYYAPVEKDDNGKLTYGTPVALAGAKSLSLDASGDDVTEYADDSVWFKTTSNSGYTGTIEFEDTAEVDAFLTKVLGWTKNADGSIDEKSTDDPIEFALMTQFSLAGEAEGAKGKRIKFYRCTASRPSVAGSTKESSISVQTNSISLTCLPRLSDDKVKSSCVSTDSAYETWFNAVEPTE